MRHTAVVTNCLRGVIQTYDTTIGLELAKNVFQVQNQDTQCFVRSACCSICGMGFGWWKSSTAWQAMFASSRGRASGHTRRVNRLNTKLLLTAHQSQNRIRKKGAIHTGQSNQSRIYLQGQPCEIKRSFIRMLHSKTRPINSPLSS